MCIRDSIAHAVEIIERLAHAHENDVRDEAPAIVGNESAVRCRAIREIAKPVARHHHLGDDLLGLEVAHQALRAGMAEGAGQRAADLAGDAERAAIDLGDIDAFDLGAAIMRTCLLYTSRCV